MTLLPEMLRKARRGQVLLTTAIISSVASRSRERDFSRQAEPRLSSSRVWPSLVSFSDVSLQSRGSQPAARKFDL